MLGNKISILILFFAYCFCIDKDSVAIYYENGLAAYSAGQYDLAVQEFNYILFSNHSISLLPVEKIMIHKALKEASNFELYDLNSE